MAGSFDRYFTEAEEKQLFSTVAQFQSLLARRDLAWMRLFRATGIRVGAMAQLTVAHARQALKTDYLTLDAAIQKRDIAHRMLATKSCKKALRSLLTIRRDMGYAETDDGFLIMSRKHKSMSVRSFQSRLTHWCHVAGLDIPASPHWFRHTVAKRIMKNSTSKDPRGVAQGVLGHISGRSTEIYTRPDKEEIEQTLREVC